MTFRPGLLLLCFAVWCQSARAAEPASTLKTLELTVDGVQRTALVHAPPDAALGPVPLVFVFHGHGRGLRAAVGGFGINRLWHGAIWVYPQGLPTKSVTDAGGVRSGWQHAVGDDGDRDLHFLDALLVRLKTDDPVDAKRTYGTGHSNGGEFT